MRIYKPDDAFPHVTGIIVVIIALIGWVFVAKLGFYFVSWTYSHHWKAQTLRDVSFVYIPGISIVLTLCCLIEAVRKGFGFVTVTLAVFLFFGLLADLFLLVGAMESGI